MPFFHQPESFIMIYDQQDIVSIQMIILNQNKKRIKQLHE